MRDRRDLTPELKALYTYPTGKEEDVVLDALIIEHSLFTETFYFLNSPVSKILETPEGENKSFESVPFIINLPEKGDVQQDLNIVIPVGEAYNDYDIREALYTAQESNEKIKVTFLVYINKNTTPEYYFDLLLTNVVIDSEKITGTATKKDLYKNYFGDDVYDLRFKGIFL